MSLINCPECGKRISDKAAACPECGCPNSEFKNNNNEREINEPVPLNESDDCIKSLNKENQNKFKIPSDPYYCSINGRKFDLRMIQAYLNVKQDNKAMIELRKIAGLSLSEARQGIIYFISNSREVQPEFDFERSGISIYDQMVEEKLNKEKSQKRNDMQFMAILLGGLGMCLIITLMIYLSQ